MLFKYYILQTLFLTIMFFCYFVDACDYSRLQCHTKTGGLDLHTPTFCNEAGGIFLIILWISGLEMLSVKQSHQQNGEDLTSFIAKFTGKTSIRCFTKAV